MKVWITKYALTTGIFIVDAEKSARAHDGITYRFDGGPLQFAFGKDWWTDELSAKSRAEEMRNRKITSLLNQIKKIETMKIEVMK